MLQKQQRVVRRAVCVQSCSVVAPRDSSMAAACVGLQRPLRWSRRGAEELEDQRSIFGSAADVTECLCWKEEVCCAVVQLLQGPHASCGHHRAGEDGEDGEGPRGVCASQHARLLSASTTSCLQQVWLLHHQSSPQLK